MTCLTKRTAATTLVSVFVLFLCWPGEAHACKPARDAVLPEPEPISGGQAAAGFVAIGVATAATSVTLGTVLDETGRFPTVTAALTSLVAPASTLAPFMGVFPSSDCSWENDMSVKAFSLRALVPLSLGILPSAVSWWASGSSTSAPMGVSVHVGRQAAGLQVETRF